MPPLETSAWRKLPLSLTELCIDTTLRCGQSFRWRKIGDEWHCTLHGRIISLKQDPHHLHYRATWPKAHIAPLSPPATGANTPVELPTDDTESLLNKYFNLHYDLSSLYQQWSDGDANFRKRAPKFTGVRILNQDAWEALVGFICSSNNNISRISQMVHKLCLHYGPYIGTIGEEAFHDFPTPSTLAVPGVESHLRELGFGYRARYIAETARNISKERPAGWLFSLRNPDSLAWAATPSKPIDDNETPPPTYKHAHEQLLQLTGVGPKVADCVCLMGLGWLEAVPVDTHVWQIAMRDYKFGGKSKNKTLTKALYDAVGDHFRSLWGDQAGWAHSVLFTADLRAFSDRLVETPAGKTEVDTDVDAKIILVNPLKVIYHVTSLMLYHALIAIALVLNPYIKSNPARGSRKKKLVNGNSGT
ncbi:N-glycosylase/DNA lyase [Cytospora mali]|uniref:DNA-(apurinic or apyrimidinic site) lyase n=1 Tax=Cytospora mali TaxID=578113 RepID=A0A194VA83_CYTMA|nr:N-glycosylase/DNA lyase [Valsa mali var. pyri (nom. inval.)]